MTISLQDYAWMAADAYDQFDSNGNPITRLNIDNLVGWDYPATIGGVSLDPADRGDTFGYASYNDEITVTVSSIQISKKVFRLDARVERSRNTDFANAVRVFGYMRASFDSTAASTASRTGGRP